MSRSTRGTIRFETPVGVPLEAAIDAGQLASDGGLPWLAEADKELGMCAAIASAVIALAKGLNLAVTAEGIETAEQLKELRALGCDKGRGYYFARPLQPESLGALLGIALPRQVA